MNEINDMNESNAPNDASGLDEQRRVALERGLAEFDRAVSTRRTRRRFARAGAAVIAIVAVVFAATRLAAPPATSREAPILASRPLPAYVQVINDDAQLSLELELASACERIGRVGGRIYVAECTRP